jgi:chaperonin cofactor prefoldin
LTSKEVDNLTDTAKVYAAVGRMFVMSSVPEIKDELKTKHEKVEKVIESCDKSKKVLIENLQGQENTLREMVDAKKKETK